MRQSFSLLLNGRPWLLRWPARCCPQLASPSGLQLIGNGDVFSYTDWNEHVGDGNGPLAACMIGRGALIKPWVGGCLGVGGCVQTAQLSRGGSASRPQQRCAAGMEACWYLTSDVSPECSLCTIAGQRQDVCGVTDAFARARAATCATHDHQHALNACHGTARVCTGVHRDQGAAALGHQRGRAAGHAALLCVRR